MMKKPTKAQIEAHRDRGIELIYFENGLFGPGYYQVDADKVARPAGDDSASVTLRQEMDTAAAKVRRCPKCHIRLLESVSHRCYYGEWIDSRDQGRIEGE